MNLSLNKNTIKSIIVKASQSGERLDRVLSLELFDYSRSQIKRWILDKKVTVNNKLVILPKKRMRKGELIKISNIDCSNVNYNNAIIVPQDIFLNIVYEDDYIVVINKPSNMVVHPGAGNYKNTVLNALLYRYPSNIKISERAGIIHRLDKDTSGLMIIAKTCMAYNNLLEAFKKRKVIKEYDAVVFGKFFCNTGVINKPIGRHVVRRTYMTVHDLGKPAVTSYSVKDTFNMHSRVRIYLKTGRTHQIRVHMAYINHPLVGDQKYGKIGSFIMGISNELNCYLRCFRRQALHACALKLLHPINKTRMEWHVPLPEDIIMLLDKLQKQ